MNRTSRQFLAHCHRVALDDLGVLGATSQACPLIIQVILWRVGRFSFLQSTFWLSQLFEITKVQSGFLSPDQTV